MNFVKSFFGSSSTSSLKTTSSSSDSPTLSKSASSVDNKKDVTFESLQSDDKSSTTENAENKKSLWNLLKDLIGVDVSTTVSLPIWMFEDTSYLQRLCEMSEFASLLDKAAQNPNQWERMLYVALYCVSGFHGTERFDKPFNPVVGETYEYIFPDNGARFLAEQVSHKPPISICHLENENFRTWVQGTLNARFLGNSIDINTTGSRGFLEFPGNNDFYTWIHPRAIVSNCLVGTVWVDHFGEMKLVNHTTKDQINIVWKKCGWFGSNKNEVEGTIVDKDGNKKIEFYGKWNKSMYAKWLFDGGENPKGKEVLLWTKDPTQIGVHKKTPFMMKLNEIDDEMKKIIPPTDARLRPDRIYLEKKESDKASVYKLKVEEKQRAEEKIRKEKNEIFVPQWFNKIPDQYFGDFVWIYSGGYWEERQKKIEMLETNPEEADKLLCREDLKGSAADFTSYPSLD